MLPGLSINTLCYEAIQRKYRNAVVGFIRQRMASAFPSDSEERIKHLFKEEEWVDIVENANMRRCTGEIETPIKDIFDYLGVNHFYNIFDKYYDLLFQTTGLSSDQAKEEKKVVLTWTKSVRNVRDPLSHPAEQDISWLDAIVVIDCARRVVAKFDRDIALEIQQIIQQLDLRFAKIDSLDEPSLRPLQDSLPPAESIAVDFIGRQKELTALSGWFTNPETRLWILAGDGGKGKTAIAHKFGLDVKNHAPRPYEIVLWLSAKRRKFVEGTITYIDTPDFTNLETAINKLLFGYGFTNDISKPLTEKKPIVLELLSELPALVIVDDIDSLEGQDEAAISFFVSDVSKTPSKILFTSRRSLFGYAPNTTQVNGFNREDGIDFIKSRIALFGLRPKDFAEPHFDAIIRVTDGSPLYIEELLRFCCVGVGLKEAMATWEKEGGDLARQFALKREFDMLSPNAKQVLLAFCLNKGPSTLDDAEVITGLSKTAVQGVLGELQRLFLIPRPTIVKGIPRFDININTRSLVLNVMSQTDVFNKIQSNVKRLSGELRISGERRLEVTEYLKQGAILTKLERFADAEGVLQNGLRKYPDDPDILAQLGRTYARWKPIPRIAEAKAHFRRAAELKCSQEDMYYHWWGLECKDSEWSSAALAAESAAKLFPNNWKFKFYAGYACSRLGRQLKLQFASDRARYQLRKADKLLTEALALINLEDLDLSEYHLHGDILRCLVLNCEAQGHVKDMARFLTQWQKEHPDDSDRIQECSRLIRKYPDLDRQLLQ